MYTKPVTPPLRQELCTWYRTVLGRRLLRLEARYLKRSLKVPYTFTIVQLGILGWETRYLDSGYLRSFRLIDETRAVRDCRLPAIVARLDSLPLASESVDVLILPHTLEFAGDQHQLLREAERVLKPEGQLLVLGFQPWTVYRLYRWLPGRQRPAPWHCHPVSHRRLLDWLNLLNFTAETNTWFDFHSLIEPGGWRDYCSSLWYVAYAVRAIKRTYTIIPLRPALETRPEWSPGVLEPTIQRKQRDPGQ